MVPIPEVPMTEERESSGFRSSLVDASMLILLSPAYAFKAGLIKCAEGFASKCPLPIHWLRERQQHKVLLNIDGDIGEAPGADDLECNDENVALLQSVTWDEVQSLLRPGTTCRVLMHLMSWLILCGAQFAGAVLIISVCFTLNSHLHGFEPVHGHILVKEAALLVSCLFWISWCIFSMLLGVVCFNCCEEWPSLFGDNEPKLFTVFGVWLLVPLVSVGWCFACGNLDAALCFVFGLLPVALLAVSLRVLLLSGRSARNRVANQV